MRTFAGHACVPSCKDCRNEIVRLAAMDKAIVEAAFELVDTPANQVAWDKLKVDRTGNFATIT